ncbi:MAG: hypothetical protein KC464_27685 [Myxococcales bacterium]|nr:hypothetical protein [Myxococcales bacterium]
MSTEYVIDPATGDLVEDDEGWFLETDTAAPRVYAQLALRFGQWWGDPQAGSRLHEATAFGDSPAGERFLESEVRRALEPLILAGLIDDVQVTAARTQPGRLVTELSYRDLTSGQVVDQVVDPFGG